MCYTYDSLGRVTARTVKQISNDSVISTETFTYDAAGNITGTSADTALVYDLNNRLISFNGNTVSYDLDGNMLNNGTSSFTYDSANRLITAGGHTYTYNAEDVRIRNLCTDEDTTYTYDTNSKLSKLLTKTTDNVVTKYVYGRGLIGEEVSSAFKTYHFDCRGSTIAITDASGNITDTFAYDTYGKLLSRTGTSKVIFGYNGRDGVVTDDNGLIYMRARYYSPEMKRFINADIIPGKLSNAITLNRFAYANGNPISFVDPFGLSAERTAANNAVLDGLEGLYNIASAYYTNKYDWLFTKDTILYMANQSALHYIIYERYYNKSYNSGPSGVQKMAWNIVTGVPDEGFMEHMKNYTEYSFLQDSNTKFYDCESGKEIDFVHMMATIAANNNSPTAKMSNGKLPSYAGWAGDLITLAGDAQTYYNENPKGSVTQYVQKALSGEKTSSFNLSDFLADVQAVGIYQRMSNTPIHTAFKQYYSDDYENRYNIFIENVFGEDTSTISSTANSYLNPTNILTSVFKLTFDSQYDKAIIQDVSTGFYNFLMAQI